MRRPTTIAGLWPLDVAQALAARTEPLQGVLSHTPAPKEDIVSTTERHPPSREPGDPHTPETGYMAIQATPEFADLRRVEQMARLQIFRARDQCETAEQDRQHHDDPQHQHERDAART